MDGCNEKHEAKGYCKRHYRSYYKYGDPLYIEKNINKNNRHLKVNYEDNHKLINEREHKKCSVCEEWYPMTTDYFYKNKSNKVDGFHPYCKECTIRKSKNYILEHHDETKKYWRDRFNYLYKNDKNIRTRQKDNQRNRKNKYQLFRNWQKNNPEKLKTYRVKRENSKKHEISKLEWYACKEYFNNSCAYCGLHEDEHYIRYAGFMKKTDLHRDHVDDTGANDLSNCVPSCKSCNGSKHTSNWYEWYKEMEFYCKLKSEKIMKWLREDYKIHIEN